MNSLYISIFLFTLSLFGKLNGRLQIEKGNEFYERGEYGDAEVAFRRALEQDVTLWQATYNLANVLYKQDRYSEAIGYYLKVLANNQNNIEGELLHNIGNAYFKLRDVSKSVHFYKRALRKYPHFDKTRYNLAYVLNTLAKQQQQKLMADHKKKSPDKEGSTPEQQVDKGNEQNQQNQDDSQQEININEVDIDHLLNLLEQEERKVHEQILRKKSEQTNLEPTGNDW